MYPLEIVQPMKEELTDSGFKELLKSEDVTKMTNQSGTSFVVVNSVCGCAAGSARPAALLALTKASKKPDNIYTVFAGYDVEALQQLRDAMKPYPPSSPAMAIFKDGKLVHFVERHDIEGSTAEMIAANITEAFNRYC